MDMYVCVFVCVWVGRRLRYKRVARALSLSLSLSLSLAACVHLHIYIYIHTHTYIYDTHTYTYIVCRKQYTRLHAQWKQARAHVSKIQGMNPLPPPHTRRSCRHCHCHASNRAAAGQGNRLRSALVCSPDDVPREHAPSPRHPPRPRT